MNPTVHQTPEIVLPDEPVVRIRPTGRWSALHLRDLWEYRELLYFLAWRDVKVRYKQTALGVVWVIIQPLLTMLIFAFIFGRVVGVPSDGIPYHLFAFAGLVPWTFFAGALTRSGNSLVGSANLITKVYFPRLIIPIAAVAAAMLDFAIAFALLAVLMVWSGVTLTLQLLLLPVVVLLTALLALGVGMWASALNVKYRDVGHILPFLVQLGMFATPIIYPVSILPEKWRALLSLNPMTGIIEGYRAALFGRPVAWNALAISAAVTVVVLVWALYVFRRMEKDFADVV
ncbi:MAG: ABC transporter permease [Blastocatellales bacterium]|nr:ABC transporter permease [Blastocatellales bacterium]